jgi:hypothetical protein
MSHPLKKFPTNVALMSYIIDIEPSRSQEVAKENIWRDSMMEDYDLLETVPKPLLPSM